MITQVLTQLKKTYNENKAQFVKFGIIGLSNTLISYTIYALLVSWNMHYIFAGFFGFVVSVLNSFYWNNKYVFKNKVKSKRDIFRALTKTYISYAFSGLFLGSLLGFIFIDILHISKYLAPFYGLCITVPLNFVLNKRWAFASHPLDRKPDPKPEYLKNEDQTADILTIGAVVLSLLILAFVFFHIKHDALSTAVDSEMIKTEYILLPYFFVPEPMENRLYIFILLCLPFLTIAFQKCFQIILPQKRKQMYSTLSLLSTLVVYGLILFAFTAIPPPDVGGPMPYLKGHFFHEHIWVYMGIFICCLGLFLTGKLKPQHLRPLRKPLDKIMTGFSLALIFMVFFASWHIPEGSIFPHFEAVIYSIAQVNNGRGLLVNFSNQYGLYPVFVRPIISVLGFSCLSITGVFAALTALSYFLVYKFIHNVVQSRFIAFLGFAAFVFMFTVQGDPLAPLPHDVDMYYQYMPIRFLFPAVLLGLGARYFKAPRRIHYYLLAILSSIGVLWNFDSGIVVFFTLLLTLIYKETLGYDFSKSLFVNITQIARKSILHIAVLAIALITVISFFCIYTHTKHGSFPDFIGFLESSKVFGALGFYKLPMPKRHPWLLAALVYIIGLSIAVGRIFTKKNKYSATMIFMTSILGCGIFSYYQGRSHNFNFIHVMYPAVLSCVVFFDTVYHTLRRSLVKKRYIAGEIAIFALFLFWFISPLLSFFDIAGETAARKFYQRQLRNITSIKNRTPSVYENDAKFIRRHVSSGEEVLILSNSQAGLYGYTGTVNPVNAPGFMELYRRDDYNKIVEHIKSGGSKLFLEESFFASAFSENTEVIHFISTNYNLVDISRDGLVYYEFAGENIYSYTYINIPALHLPDDIQELKQQTYNIDSIDIQDGKIILSSNSFDPQFYIPLLTSVEKPAEMSFIEITYTNSNYGLLKIYYDYGEGLSEKASSQCFVTPTSEKKIARLPIIGEQGEKLSGIRLDPPDSSEFTLINAEICLLNKRIRS